VKINVVIPPQEMAMGISTVAEDVLTDPTDQPYGTETLQNFDYPISIGKPMLFSCEP